MISPWLHFFRQIIMAGRCSHQINTQLVPLFHISLLFHSMRQEYFQYPEEILDDRDDDGGNNNIDDDDNNGDDDDDDDRKLPAEKYKGGNDCDDDNRQYFSRQIPPSNLW